jgi:hypothetical protein
LETIASKQACFINKQIFSYNEKRYRLPRNSCARALYYMHWHIPHRSHACTQQTSKLVL